MAIWVQSLLSGLGVFLLVIISSFFAWVVRKLAAHDTALALLIQQVNPPGDKSLRELLHDIQLDTLRQNVKS